MGVLGGKGPIRRSVRVLMVGALAAVSVTPASAALWHENYDSALRAMRAEEWGQAVGFLEQAIQQRPKLSIKLLMSVAILLSRHIDQKKTTLWCLLLFMDLEIWAKWILFP